MVPDNVTVTDPDDFKCKCGVEGNNRIVGGSEVPVRNFLALRSKPRQKIIELLSFGIYRYLEYIIFSEGEISLDCICEIQ